MRGWDRSRTYVVTDRGPASNVQALHIIRVPGLGQPEGYVSLLSIEAFQERLAHQLYQRQHVARKPVGRWLSVTRKHDWLAYRRIDVFRLNHGKPITKHASVWDFYNHIGYDYKKKRYRTLSGHLEGSGADLDFHRKQAKQGNPDISGHADGKVGAA